MASAGRVQGRSRADLWQVLGECLAGVRRVQGGSRVLGRCLASAWLLLAPGASRLFPLRRLLQRLLALLLQELADEGGVARPVELLEAVLAASVRPVPLHVALLGERLPALGAVPRPVVVRARALVGAQVRPVRFTHRPEKAKG